MYQEEVNENKVNQEEMKAIQEIIELASEMRLLLTECRNEQINYKLANRIDNLLNKYAKK